MKPWNYIMIKYLSFQQVKYYEGVVLIDVYKRSVGFYVVEEFIGNRSRPMNYDRAIRLIELVSEKLFPLSYLGKNSSLKEKYSAEKIPVISDFERLGNYAFGIVGYLRSEGLSHVWDRRTNTHSPLFLPSYQDLYEYVHFLLLNVKGVAVFVLEHASFAPRYGIISRLLTDSLEVFCQDIYGSPLCDNTRIHLRKLYRARVEALLMNFDVVRKISIRAERNMVKYVKDYYEFGDIGSKILKAIKSLAGVNSGRYVEVSISVGRARDDYITTIEDILNLYTEFNGRGLPITNFIVTVKGVRGTQTFDLVNEALSAEVKIMKGVYREGNTVRISRSTDTADAKKKMLSLADSLSNAINESVEKYLKGKRI